MLCKLIILKADNNLYEYLNKNLEECISNEGPGLRNTTV